MRALTDAVGIPKKKAAVVGELIGGSLASSFAENRAPPTQLPRLPEK